MLRLDNLTNLKDLAALRESAPSGIKDAGRSVVRALARPTASLRLLPGFIVAGGSRCGTTSLHRALLTHPGVVPPVLTKGVHWFDVDYTRSIDWYRSHFPLAAPARRRTAAIPGVPLAFESSGYYMHHPLAPARIAANLPDAKIVVMLRDPIERAYSAWKHEHARGFEPIERFEQALELEPLRLAGEIEKIKADPAYVSHAHRHQSYVDRGQYVEQLRRLHELFGADRVHVVWSEDFFADPRPTYEQLLTFLDLPIVHAPSYEQYNARTSKGMSPQTRARLAAHFEPYDDALIELTGEIPSWRR